MARAFLIPVDFNKNEIRNPRLQNLSTAPSSPVTGQIYYDTDDNKAYHWNGGSWVSMSEQSGGVTYATPAIALAATAAAGAAATVIRSDSTIAAFDATVPTTQAIGDAAATGSAAFAARRDHLHAMPAFGAVTAQTSFGAASNNGAGTTIARNDHVHGTPTHDGAAHSAISISSLSVPTADVAWNSKKITGVLDPTAAQDAATKAYVDSVATGLDVHPSVRAATTANIANIATAAPNTLDGVTLAANDRILVKDQSTQTANGIYFVSTLGTGSNGVWTRALDADASAEVTPGLHVFVEEGTTWGDTGWVLTTNAPITLGSSNLVFSQFSGAGSWTAGTGMTQTGTTLNVIAGTGMVANADDIAVLRTDANGRVPLKYAATFGDNSATSFNIDHNLNSLDVIVQVWQVSDGMQVEPDITRSTVNRVVLAFTTAPTTSQFRVCVYG